MSRAGVPVLTPAAEPPLLAVQQLFVYLVKKGQRLAPVASAGDPGRSHPVPVLVLGSSGWWHWDCITPELLAVPIPSAAGGLFHHRWMREGESDGLGDAVADARMTRGVLGEGGAALLTSSSGPSQLQLGKHRHWCPGPESQAARISPA